MYGMKKEFRDKFEELGVFIVYLFGSRSIKKGSPLSDVDIGVVLKDPSLGKNTRQLYHSLYQLFSDLYPASELDIVLLQIAPLSLQYSAVKEGKVVFEEDPTFTADYENFVINQYLDFRPVLDLFDRATLGRYA
jgi:predicted nucleotidyltransferase